MSIDAESIVLKLGIILFSYVLVVVLIFAPWLVIRCRARYNVACAEWRCRACKEPHTGSVAAYRKCLRCHKIRHFVNPAPLGMPSVCVLTILFGAFVAIAGGILMQFDRNMDTRQLINIKDVLMEPSYLISEDKGMRTMDSRIALKVLYAELYVDLPVRVQAMGLAVTFCSRKIEHYKKQIGHLEIPTLKVYPGDELQLVVSMRIEMETDMLATMFSEMSGDGALFQIGPSILHYELQPGKFISWVLGDSDLEVANNFKCSIVSTLSGVLHTNCTDYGKSDKKFVQILSFYNSIMVIVGCMACGAGMIALEWHLQSSNTSVALQIAATSKRRPSLQQPV